MPTYLLHGFRWHRASIRIHVILQDLEDAAPEWIIAPATSATLLDSFYSTYDFLPPRIPHPTSQPVHVAEKQAVEDDLPLPPPPRILSKKNTRSMSSLRSLGRRKKEKVETNGLRDHANSNGDGGAKLKHDRHASGSDTSKTAFSTGTPSTRMSAPEKPTSFNDWSAVKLIEQYNPNDLESVSQPYAYVADYLIDITLSASLAEEMAKYEAKAKENENSGHAVGSASPGTPGTASEGNSGDLSARDVKAKSKKAGWLEKLRDGLQNGEPLGWYVVVCGDEERRPPTPSLIDEEDESASVSEESEELSRTPRSGGFRQFFRGKKGNAEN